MKRIFVWLLALATVLALAGCEIDGSGSKSDGSKEDISRTKEAANELQANQPTPTDIEYSLERYNLIRRAYWVNGQREKADALPCEVAKPLGYVVLLTEGGSVVGRFTVDGKVSSLNSFLTPGSVDSTYGNSSGGYTTITSEMADIDGSYGENDNGIFFFTPDGKYVEWSGIYLYSDIPFKVDSPVIEYTEVG